MKRTRTRKTELKVQVFLAVLILFEVVAIISLLIFSSSLVFAGIGANVTVRTQMQIGNSAPEIVNITIGAGLNSVDLVQNSTSRVIVQAIVRDYNGEGDISYSSMEFYDNAASFYGDSSDNNDNYRNTTCSLDLGYGDSTEVNATCTFDVWYYANNATWNATVFANDTNGLTVIEHKQTLVNSLLSIGLPDSIDYGLVNATNVSSEQIANVTNFGNVRVNLSIQGYAYNLNDGWAMNCTLGSTKNISVHYEKYNLTTSHAGTMSLAQFSASYANLTSSVAVKTFNLNYRQNDGVNEAINTTYWRIYVPQGVAGSCSGNILFGATRASGT